MLHTEHKPLAGVARARQRQGIALVTVLGMLCLLVVLAVAFAIAMRTERIAGRSFTDTVRVRQLAYAGLYRAIDAANSTMGNNFCLNTPLYTAGGGATLLTGSATNYIPLGALGTNSAVTNLIGWQQVCTYSSTVGRIAYLIVDCSGYLDANRSGGPTHTTGLSATELVLDPVVLADSAGLPSSGTLIHSVAELKQKLGQPSQNFVTYSAFPPYKLNPASPSNDLIMLDVPAATLSSAAYRARILTALQACGLTLTQAGDTYSNLLAYADTSTDVPPGGPDNFYTKSVPMLDEVVVSNAVTGASGNWMHRTYVYYEAAYPFPVSPPYSYQVTVTGLPTITPTTPPDGQAWSAPVLESAAPAAFIPAANSYNTNGNVFIYRQTSASTNVNLNTMVTTATVQLAEAWIKNVGGTGANVDHMPAGTAAMTVNTSATGRRGLGVYDPRINWRVSDWVLLPAVGNLTPGRRNVPNGGIFAANKEGYRMFARTSGTIANAAELGCLLYDATNPNFCWRSIKLYDDGEAGFPMHPVLDYFGVSSQTNALRRGLVNINSQNTNVLATAFVNTPIQLYPGGPTTGTVSATDAQMIASQLIPLTGAQGTNSLAVVGRAVGQAFVALAGAGFSGYADDGNRESVIANSYRLLSPRQNLFTVLIAAQVSGSGGALAEVRAVALVWRDPYPDASGRHPTLVRFFKWLME